MSGLKRSKRLFGQLVVGPPGSGKTTYCWKMAEHLRRLGREVVLVNLDPANDILPYEPDVDVRSLIDLSDVMDELSLGPNAGLVYCVEYLEANFAWLAKEIADRGEGRYFIFDVPGQVELYGHHSSLGKIFEKLRTECEMNVCTIHLVDSHHCSDAGKFVSALMVSLCAMLRIGLPHVNVLSKVDLLKKHADELKFGMDYYGEVLNLEYLLETLDMDSITSKYKRLNSALTSIIEDYSLVSFVFLDVFSEESLSKIKVLADRANGFGFKTDEKTSINSMLACAIGMEKDERSPFDL